MNDKMIDSSCCTEEALVENGAVSIAVARLHEECHTLDSYVEKLRAKLSYAICMPPDKPSVPCDPVSEAMSPLTSEITSATSSLRFNIDRIMEMIEVCEL